VKIRHQFRRDRRARLLDRGGGRSLGASARTVFGARLCVAELAANALEHAVANADGVPVDMPIGGVEPHAAQAIPVWRVARRHNETPKPPPLDNLSLS
jgi:hypothetical protein